MKTNHQEVEYRLLLRFNLQQSVRFLLAGAFAQSEPRLTAQVKRVYNKCPQIFSSICSRADRVTDFEQAEPSIQGDDNHLSPCVFKRLSRVQSSALGLPHRFDEPLSDRWLLVALRNAYDHDYRIPSAVSLGDFPARWFQQISFTER